MTNRNVNRLAEKIAQILDSEISDSDSSLQSSIDKLNTRLDSIEERLGNNQLLPTVAPQSTHPSQERFDIIEAIVDGLMDGSQKEKTCAFEPNGKSCDHCSMCSSRGF